MFEIEKPVLFFMKSTGFIFMHDMHEFHAFCRKISRQLSGLVSGRGLKKQGKKVLFAILDK